MDAAPSGAAVVLLTEQKYIKGLASEMLLARYEFLVYGKVA